MGESGQRLPGLPVRLRAGFRAPTVQHAVSRGRRCLAEFGDDSQRHLPPMRQRQRRRRYDRKCLGVDGRLVRRERGMAHRAWRILVQQRQLGQDRYPLRPTSYRGLRARPHRFPLLSIVREDHAGRLSRLSGARFAKSLRRPTAGAGRCQDLLGQRRSGFSSQAAQQIALVRKDLRNR